MTVCTSIIRVSRRTCVGHCGSSLAKKSRSRWGWVSRRTEAELAVRATNFCSVVPLANHLHHSSIPFVSCSISCAWRFTSDEKQQVVAQDTRSNTMRTSVQHCSRTHLPHAVVVIVRQSLTDREDGGGQLYCYEYSGTPTRHVFNRIK